MDIETGNEYYIYRYFAEKSGKIENMEGKTIELREGDTYYIGKGNRVKRGARNYECEQFKKVFGFRYEIIKENMEESQAYEYEGEKIEEYRKEGKYLTNRYSGGSGKTDNETIGVIKYLILLRDNDVIKMSDEDIAIETESYSGVVWEIRNGKRGIDIGLVIPDNLSYILKEYDPVDEKSILYSNIKYVIELSENHHLW